MTNYRQPALGGSSHSSGLGGLLAFTPTPALSPYPGVAPAPVVPANRQSPFAPSSVAPHPPAPSAGGVVGGGVAGGAVGGGVAGGLGGYAVNATPALGQDPAYLAFLRALGIEKADLNQSAQDRISVINREIARRLPDILQAGVYSREGIDNNFESRGVYRSGAHEVALGRERADEARQTAALQGAAADQVFLINQELNRRLAEANRRGADQSLTSAGNIYA